MAREYIPRTWTYGKPAWYRTKALLQDYDRLRREREDILRPGIRQMDAQPRGTDISDPTGRGAIRLARINEELEAIDQSAVQMRGILSKKVQQDFDPVHAYWSYDYYNYQCVRKTPEDLGPCIRTWRNYRVQFLSLVALKAKII